MYSSTINFVLGTAFYYAVFITLVLLFIAKLVNWINDKTILFIAGIILVGMAALRLQGVDKDYETYVYSFRTLQQPLDYFRHLDDWLFFEPLYYLIPSTLKLLFGKIYYSYLTFACFAILSVSVLFVGLKRFASFPELSVIHYYSYLFFLHEMTQIRAGLACALLLWIAYYHYKKKYAYSIILFFLALLVHYTAILILLIFLFNTKNFNRAVYLLLILAAIALAVAKLPLLPETLLQLNYAPIQKMTLVLNSMTLDQNKINVFNVGFLMNLSVTVWLIINHKKIFEHNRFSYLLLKMQVLSILCYGLFSSISVIAFRISEFFGVVNILTVPLIVYSFRERWIGYSIVIVYSFLLLVVNLQFTEVVQPYKSILSLWHIL